MSRKSTGNSANTSYMLVLTSASFQSPKPSTWASSSPPTVSAWTSHLQLANTQENQGSAVIPQVCQLLQMFYLQPFGFGGATQRINFWSQECHQVFDTLKAVFTSKPILTHWMPDSQLIVEIDTLDYAVAAILSQICGDGKL
jgi:hypothetical protein